MLSLPLPVKIFWRKEHTDLRKSFDGLAAIVREELGHDPFSGHLFIFASKRRNRVKLLYLLSLAGARRTLDLQSPYVVLDESTEWSLMEARRRGVRVRLLVEGDMTDAKPVKYASRSDYDALLAAGIEIHEFQPTMMHVKALVVDGAWSIVGSTNFDNRSMELNDEINVAIADRNVAARLTEDFEGDLRRSKRLKLDAWRARGASDTVREKFWSLFGELF